MFCTRCGLKNDDDALFCAGCGNRMKIPQGINTNIQENNIQTNETISEETTIDVDITNEDTEIQNTESSNMESSSEITDFSTVDDEESQEDKLSESTSENVVVLDKENLDNEDVQDKEDSKNAVVLNKETTENADNKQDNLFNNGLESSVIEIEPQTGTSNFNTMPQSGNNGYSYNNQNMYNNNNVYNNQMNNNQQQYNNKFSVKRFIFSALVIIAAIVSCVGIAIKYVEVSMKSEAYGQTVSFVQNFKGNEIIKNDDFYIDIDEIDGIYASDDDVVEVQKAIRILVIISAITIIIFAVIELVLLIGVRRRWAYVLSMLFSMIQMFLSGTVMYLWCFEFLDEFKEIYKTSMILSSTYSEISIKVTAGIGAGLIMILVSQAVIFISSIVLMTCKNRPKMQRNF